MAKYRNITNETLYVVTANGYVSVAPGDVVEGDDSTYWQTGETGETPLFEAAGTRRPSTQSPKNEGAI